MVYTYREFLLNMTIFQGFLVFFLFLFVEMNKMVWRVSSTFSCDGLNEVCMDASLCSSRCLNLFMNNPFAFWSIAEIWHNNPSRGWDMFHVLSIPPEIRSVHKQSLQRIRSVSWSFNPFRGSELYYVLSILSEFKDNICSNNDPSRF